MRSIIFVLSLVLCGVVISNIDAKAQTPQERAAEMIQWREHCNDPDPDLRLAYIESAIATEDVTIQRICIRCALESDSSDIINLGIRAAIASKRQITFSVEIPKDLEIALQKAGDDNNALKEIYSSNIYKSYHALKNGLTIAIVDAKTTSPSSIWYPLVGLSKQNDNYKGIAINEGNRIIWTGNTYINGESSINVMLEQGGKLKGFFQSGKLPVFSISADLL